MSSSDASQGDEVPAEAMAESLDKWFYREFIANPINCAILLLVLYMTYKFLFRRWHASSSVHSGAQYGPQLPPMKRQDMVLSELAKYDGNQDEGRICVAILGKIFDVTRARHFYGPEGPYSAFAGHDISRALAKFDVSVITDDYDDLSDLTSCQLDEVREWQTQFAEKYECVGKLIRMDEEPTRYSEDEAGRSSCSESTTSSSDEKEGEVDG